MAHLVPAPAGLGGGQCTRLSRPPPRARPRGARRRLRDRLHFVGSSAALALLVAALATELWWLVAIALVEGYAFAWVGHFFFERNRPATFKYPLLSFMGDWRLWWDIVSGRIPF